MNCPRWAMLLLLCTAGFCPEGSAGADVLHSYLFSPLDPSAMPPRSKTSGPPGESWISDPELRIAPERDRFDRSSQTYSFRFRPIGSKERTAIESISRISNAQADTRWQRSVSGVLAARYHRLIDLAWREVDVALAAQQLLLDRSLLQSEQLLSATGEYDAGRLQGAALRIERRTQTLHQVEQLKLGMRAATIGNYLAVETAATPAVSRQLIHPLMIASWLDEIAATPASASFQGRLAQLEIDQARHRASIEEARSGFGLSLMELSYEDKQVDSYNLTFGIRLPFGHSKNTLYRRQRDLSAARQQSWLVEQSFNESLQFAIQKIRWQIDNYAMISDSLNKLHSRRQHSANDVVAIAERREHELDLLQSAATIHIEVLHDFVVLLELAGLLHDEPRRNWIARTVS